MAGPPAVPGSTPARAAEVEVEGAGAAERVRFTAVGDYWSGEGTTDTVLRGIRAAAPDAHFALGDLSYAPTGTEQRWCDFVKQHVGPDVPFELLAGNHESNGQHGFIDTFAACLPNRLPGLVGSYGKQYYVDVPAEDPLVRFVMISPALPFPEGTWTYHRDSERYRWTATAIDDARRAGIPWVVVGSHKPCLSLGSFSCEIGTDLTELLLDRGVDLVLHGHEHSYMRTKQIALRHGCAALTVDGFDPDCVVDADDDFVAGAGTVFVTIGTGGIEQRAPDPDDPESGYFRRHAGGKERPVFGFGRFEVTRSSMTARYVGTAGEAFSDAFTLTKPGQPPAYLARDRFEREVDTGWGQAESGGAWKVDGAPAEVRGGRGVRLLTAGTGRARAELPGVRAGDVDVRVTLGWSGLRGRGLLRHEIAVRREATRMLLARISARSGGLVALRLFVKDRAGLEPLTGPVRLPSDVRLRRGLRVQVRAVGATVRLRAWRAGGEAPSRWTLTTRATQAPATGRIRLVAQRRGGEDVRATYDDFRVVDLS